MKANQLPEFPDFEDITKECKAKILEKFPQYGNSWKHEPLTLEWWFKRLDDEIKEIKTTQDPIVMSLEILDAINILSMMYERIGARCQKCGLRLINFHVMDGKPICMDCFLPTDETAQESGNKL